MSAIPTVRARLRHVLAEAERKEFKRLRQAAWRNGRKFSKDNYTELLRTEDPEMMSRLRSNGTLDWFFILRKFPGMPSVTPSTGSDRSFGSSSDSSPSTSAENSPADASRERHFEFPTADENQPTHDISPISSRLRKRLGQLSTLCAFNDLRPAYTEDDQRRQKLRRNSDPDDDAMPVLVVNAPVPPPPQFLQPDGGGALVFDADEHDYLAQLADAMFPVGLDEEVHGEPPPLVNNAPRPSKFANTGNVPLAMRDSTKVEVQDCGRLTEKCTKCGALFFPGEAKRNKDDGSFGPCCCFGAVSLPTTYDDFPRSIYELLKWEHALSADFHRHIRNYNSSLSFASINCNLDRRYTGSGGGHYCFRIHGNVYTLFNDGTYTEGVPSYAQLYVVDSAQATDYRMQHKANEGISRELLHSLDQELRRVNLHAQSYQMLREVEDEHMEHQRRLAKELEDNGMEVEEQEPPSFKLLFKLPADVDRRRYNIPTANEIAAVFRTNADGSIPPAELIVHSGNGRTYRLSTLSPLVAPFTFPLLFPTGKEGWTPMLPLARDIQRRWHVSRREYLSHQIQVRSDRHDNIIFNPLHYAGKLFQEYVVINYVHVEGDRLEWIRSNQAELRAHDYKGLHDKIDEICKNKNLAKSVTVLPATFPGSARYMQRNYEDAMAIVRRFGKPDLFLTMTCNPNWQEVVESLGVKPDGTPVDASTRPDLLARVFYLKLKKLLDDIKGTKTRPGCFGKYKNFVYTVEYQKRGLPHVHMLITLDDRSKLKTAEDIDKVISAEIPDQQKDPFLYDLVKNNMVHGPCDQATFPCLDAKGCCTKKFPKAFLEQTRLEEDGYPLYRRSQNGRELVYGSGQRPRRADNRWVVPYCPALLKKYNCHMNVEIVQGIRAVKYLYKYIFKGFDRAFLEIAPTDNVLEWDEVSQHLDARYVSSSEACARLLRKALHDRSHAVIRLHVHKQGQAPTAEEEAEADEPNAGEPENAEEAVGDAYDNIIQIDAVDQSANADGVVAQPALGTGIVDGNQEHASPTSDDEEGPEAPPADVNAPSGSNRNIAPPSKSTLNAWLAYNRDNDDGRHLTYVEFCSQFRFDKNGNKWIKRKQEANIIGRMFNVSPRDQEAYNLRLLLFYVKGAKNFKDIRTVTENGVDTVYPTYTAAALARGLIEDDSEHIKAMEEAVTFAIGHRLRRFFVMILVHCEVKDYKAFWERFKDELAADYMHRLNNEQRAVALAYADILELLSENGKNRERDFPEFPVPTIVHDPDVINPEDERDFFEELERTLNDDQQRVVQFVKDYLNRGCRGNNCVYVGGLGGSGKTYVYKALYHLIRSHPNGGLVVNMASTGIAATLLPGGRTVHSAFGLPITMFSDSKSSFDGKTAPAHIRQAKAFVLDEVSMCSKFVLECVDRTLSKVHKTDDPFGGVLFIIGGDFRQCMPIKQRALPSELFELSVKRSELWARFKKFILKRNIRALHDPEYAQYAVDVGDGVGITRHEGDVSLMPDIVSAGDLVEEVYGDLKSRYLRMLESQRLDFLAERAILCPLNCEVSRYNEVVLNALPGNVTTYRSYDLLDVDATAESRLYPPELLNTINPSSLPPHELNVKEGCVVMLLRNLNISSGLCNGTRLYVDKVGRKLLDCKILTGPRKGERELIPRIKLNYDGNELPVVFARRQFPVRLAFAMTINKSQGQTLKSVGVDIRNPAFSHGQLYVALSRVRDRHSIKVLTNGPSMRNIVYKPVLH